MTHAEQHAIIEELKDFARKMSRYEQDEFDMFVKRDKDDEDLDALSQQRLQQMHATYVRHRKRFP
jgi:hypothetical protein